MQSEMALSTPPPFTNENKIKLLMELGFSNC